MTNDQSPTAPKRIERDDVMQRMRGAVTMLNTGRFNERTKLIAFLMLQHPELGPDKIVALANAAREDARR